MTFEMGLPEGPIKIDNEPLIRLAVIYNVFDTTDIEKHELEFNNGWTLERYLEGLPEEVTWGIGVNGVVVEGEQIKTMVLEKGDLISLAVVPEGGDGIKSVLRIVAMIAVVALTYGVASGALTLGGLITSTTGALVAGAAIAVGGSLLINALLPMQMPTMADNGEQSKTYGVDGAKNSAEEGGTVPIVYGEYRVGGNFSDIYNVNSGDTQVLYLRNVLCDGKIDSVSKPLINDQPIENFNDLEWHYSLGTNTDTVDEWFPAAIRMQNKGQKIDTSGVIHLTTGDLDRARFDIIFPKGLVTINEKDGKYERRTAKFSLEYSSPGLNVWSPLPVGKWQATSGFTTPTDTKRIRAVVASNGFVKDLSYTLRYRLVGSPTWTVWRTGSVARPVIGRIWGHDGIGDLDAYQASEEFSVITLPIGEYEVEIQSGATGVTLSRIETFGAGSNIVSHTDNKTGAIRQSYETASIPRGTYDLRIKRVGAEGNNDKTILDEAHLTDIAEIDDHPTALINTATASLRAVMTDQLGRVPKVTWLVKGAVLQEYDIEGVKTIERWSDNPAWIVLDMLIGEQRGVGFPLSRIDFSGWNEWARYCIDNDLTFNGVFDAGTNLWDAMTQVMKVGHAISIRSGTRLSLAIEGRTEPSMMFGSTAILKDSFAIQFHASGDRANEIEATYFDRSNNNKPVVIRVVDPEAERLDLPQRTSTVNLYGVDNHAQAIGEIWRQIYSNRLIKRTCSFRAQVEAIGVTIGDVALIQHDMTDWGLSGRLEVGSTDLLLNLDRPVEMLADKSYSVLAHYPAIKNYDSVVTSVIGQTIYVTGIPVSPDNITRLVQGSIDVSVTDVSWGDPLTALTVEGDISAILNASCELWLTDAMFERTVTLNVGEQTAVALSQALPEVPTSGFQWVFGETLSVKRPYRLTSITGAGHEERTLSFVEYNDAVYDAPERIIPADTAHQSDIVPHVVNLEISYDRRQGGDSASVHTFLKWNTGGVLNYGGADIYMKLNDADWRSVSTVLNVNEFYIALSPDDKVAFKVISFNEKGYRASGTNPPIVERNIFVERMDLDAPRNINVVNDTWTTKAGVTVTWEAPLDDARVFDYKIEWRSTTVGATTNWIPLPNSTDFEVKISGLYVGTYEFRVRSERNYSYSNWVVFSLIIGAPEVITVPTGLTLFNGTPEVATDTYNGKDAEWTWADASFNVESGKDYYFLDYLVTIKDTSDNIIRQDSVQDARYAYTFENNLADHLATPGVTARRSFKIEVQSRGRQGQASAPATMTVDNPRPAVPTGIDVQGGIDTTYISYIKPTDSDFEGVQVYLGYSTGFASDASSLVYEGSNNLISLPTPGENGAARYIRLRPYDAFGKDALSESSEFSATNVAVVVDADQENWTTESIQISAQKFTDNRVDWTAGVIHTEKADVRTTYPIITGSFDWISGTHYIYFDKVGSTLKATASIAVATGVNKRVMAVYKGGTELQVSMGDVIIDGSKLLANTIGAGQLVADQVVITGAAQIQNGIITNAKIGNIIQSLNWNDATKSGWKIDKNGSIQANSITIYDVSGNIILSSGTVAADLLNSALAADIAAAANTANWDNVSGAGKPATNATRNTGSLADKNSVNLAGSFVDGILPTTKAASGLKNANTTKADVGLPNVTDGADITSSKTSADTAKVNGTTASTVQGGAVRANAGLDGSGNVRRNIGETYIPVLGSNKINVANLAAISANVGTITAGLLRSSDSKMKIDLNAKTILIET